MRYSRAEYTKILAAQQEVSRAEDDYHRLREAYVALAKAEPSNEVGLAMVGADMDRAHAHLQVLIGLPRMAAGHEPAPVHAAADLAEEEAQESA